MRRISIKALLLAVVAILLLDLIASFVLILAVGSSSEYGLKAVLESEVLLNAVTCGNPFLVGSLILGTIATFIGGYVVASVATRDPYVNAFVLGVVGLAVGAFLSGGFPIWFNALSFASVMPATLLGAHLRCGKK